jgi:hypothetical protein
MFIHTIKRIFISFCHSYRLSGANFFLATPAGREQNKHLMRHFNLSLPVPHTFVVDIEEFWRKEFSDR